MGCSVFELFFFSFFFFLIPPYYITLLFFFFDMGKKSFLGSWGFLGVGYSALVFFNGSLFFPFGFKRSEPGFRGLLLAFFSYFFSFFRMR